ncbi:flippase [Novosphingobium sp.]|uniref:flippase n=1 Tax=Novosphingobium sp. TaxID=1874826 RepID=UPI00286E03CE|nr:flippase [Novosphingobium sp.]
MSLVKNSFYSLAGTILPIVIGIATVPFYIRAIGMERYGALSIAWLLLGYFGQADFGIGRAITQRIASCRGADAKQLAEIVWSGLAAISGFAVLGALLIYWGGHWFFGSLFKVEPGLRGELLDSLWMLALCNPIVALTGVTSGSLMGIERFKLVSLSNLIGNSALQLLPLLAASLLGNHLGVLIAASLIARGIALVMMSGAVWWRFLRGQAVAISAREARHLMSFGKWVMVSAFVSPLMIFADRFVIGSVLGAVAVAAYAIPFQIANRTTVIPSAIAQVLFPRFAFDSHERSKERAAEATIAVGLAFAPVILVLMALAQPLLELWLGSRLDPRSVPVAQIVLAGFWVNGIANVPYALIQARGNPRFTALLHSVELPFYMAMLYFLGLQWGLIGLAVAFSLRCLVDLLVLLKAGHSWNATVLGTLLPPALAVLVVLAIANHLHSWQNAFTAAIGMGFASLIYAVKNLPEEMSRPIRSLIYRLVPGLK